MSYPKSMSEIYVYDILVNFDVSYIHLYMRKTCKGHNSGMRYVLQVFIYFDKDVPLKPAKF